MSLYIRQKGEMEFFHWTQYSPTQLLLVRSDQFPRHSGHYDDGTEFFTLFPHKSMSKSLIGKQHSSENTILDHSC